MLTITKKDLIYQISEKTGLKKVITKEIIQSFIDEIIKELAEGNRLEFREFGVFEIKHRAPRRARNPRTGTSVDVPAKKVVHFKAGRVMKQRVLEDSSETKEPDPPSQSAFSMPSDPPKDPESS